MYVCVVCVCVLQDVHVTRYLLGMWVVYVCVVDMYVCLLVWWTCMCVYWCGGHVCVSTENADVSQDTHSILLLWLGTWLGMTLPSTMWTSTKA